MQARIMYIERKRDEDGDCGPARIGRVSFSKTGKTIYYQGKSFARSGGQGIRGNYYDEETREEYWISGPHKDGADRLFGERVPVEIDEDVREEYWLTIRNCPQQIKDRIF